MARPRVAALVALAMFLVCIGRCLSSGPFTDTAYFGGDEWYFQSIAVNVHHGDGYRLGGLRDFAEYKFTRDTHYSTWMKHDELYDHFYATDEFNFYASPGYVLFLSGVYRVTGVRPVVVKYLQVLLLALTAALIPIISARSWPRWGLVTGAVASAAFVFLFAPDPGLIMGEPLVIALLAVWGLLVSGIERRVSVGIAAALGVCTGLLLLVKTYALLPVLFVIYLLVRLGANRRAFATAAVYLAVTAAVILPWSLYASRHSDGVVVVATQLDNLLLDGNNEDTIRSGGFSPGWRKWNKGDPSYLYNRIEDEDMGTFRKVGLFYRHNWTRVPELFARKVFAATGRSPLVVSVLVLFVLFYAVALRRRRDGDDVPVPVFPLFCFLVWLSNTLVAFGLVRYTLIFLPFMAMAAAQAPPAVWAYRERRRATS